MGTPSSSRTSAPPLLDVIPRFPCFNTVNPPPANTKTDAVEILKKIVNFLGGKGGGGRKDLAQGGAPMSEKLDEVEKYLVKLF